MTKININTPETENQDQDEVLAEQAADTETVPAEPELSELEKAQQEAADNYDRYVRLAAEFENYKKRVSKDKEDYYKYANESFIKTLLPVLDYLEMGLEAARKAANTDQNLLQGFELMAGEFRKVLEKAHVEIIEPDCGADFDPNFQECVMQQETDEYPPNRVCSTYQKGYKLYDHLLRPARVVTSKCK